MYILIQYTYFSIQHIYLFIYFISNAITV